MCSSQCSIVRLGVLESKNKGQINAIRSNGVIFLTAAGFTRTADQNGWSIYFKDMLNRGSVTPEHLVEMPLKNGDPYCDENERLFVFGIGESCNFENRFLMWFKHNDVSFNDNHNPKRGMAHGLCGTKPHPPKGDNLFSNNEYIGRRQLIKEIAESFEVFELNQLGSNYLIK